MHILQVTIHAVPKPICLYVSISTSIPIEHNTGQWKEYMPKLILLKNCAIFDEKILFNIGNLGTNKIRAAKKTQEI